MEFFRYFKFYHNLTAGRIYVYVLISLVAISLQGVAAFAFLPVFQLGNPKPDKYVEFAYKIIEHIPHSGEKGKLLILLSITVVSFMLSAVAVILSNIYVARLQAFVLTKIEMDVNRKLLNADYQYFSSKSLGYLNNAIMQQIPVTAFSFKFYAAIIMSSMFAIFYLSIPIMMNHETAIMLFLFCVPFMLVYRFFAGRSKHYSVINTENSGELNAFLMQMLCNYKYLKATDACETALGKLKSSLRKMSKSLQRLTIYTNIPAEAVTPFAVAIMSSLVYLQYASGKSSLEDIVILLGLLYFSYQKAAVIPAAYQKFVSSIGAIRLYQSLLGELEKNQEHSVNQGVKPDFSGPIEFRGVAFSYRSGSQEVIRNISLSIAPATSVALVGRSGSGKSTIVNLINGLLKPTSGEILLSGMNYNDIDIRDLRRNIGYVTQEPVIFNDTIKNNISMWQSRVDNMKIEEAFVRSYSKEFIMEMDRKYDSVLGDQGVNISGGQRQRITMAREFYKDSPVLILDEATSSLDSETEQIIQQSIEDLKGEKTLIIIAHRLSTVKNCDKIIVLENGKIVEQGNFQELVDKGGKFKEMVERQSLN